jgi:hypothetical protein
LSIAATRLGERNIELIDNTIKMSIVVFMEFHRTNFKIATSTI